MDSRRKVWQKPSLNEISVNDVLAQGPAGNLSLGPPGWASPGPLITGAKSPLDSTSINQFGPFSPPIDFSPATSAEGPPLPVSDARLKEDVTMVGRTVHGLPLYSFRYRGQTALYEGVMAQDVIAVRPDAVVVASDGFYRVDYARLGIECRRIG
ncbi:MAG: tail fiber domain-containing protein [Reyranellaceae bacterium]